MRPLQREKLLHISDFREKKKKERRKKARRKFFFFLFFVPGAFLLFTRLMRKRKAKAGESKLYRPFFASVVPLRKSFLPTQKVDSGDSQKRYTMRYSRHRLITPPYLGLVIFDLINLLLKCPEINWSYYAAVLLSDVYCT